MEEFQRELQRVYDGGFYGGQLDMIQKLIEFLSKESSKIEKENKKPRKSLEKTKTIH